MKRIGFTISMALLCLIGPAIGQTYNNHYAISSTDLINYVSNPLNETTRPIDPETNITIGFAGQVDNPRSNDIIVMKTKAESGIVIWAKRYGLKNINEQANSFEISYDGKDIIVVGTAENKDNPSDQNALAMRIGIQDGLVKWAAEYGMPGVYEEWILIEKSSKGPSIGIPTYFLAGRTLESNNSWKIYSGAIYDDGGAKFLKSYAGNYWGNQGSTPPSNFVSSMVQNKTGNFIIAGTTYESGGVGRLFTVGVNPSIGSLTDAYTTYGANNVTPFINIYSSPSITKVSIGRVERYAMSFTVTFPQLGQNINSAIGVMTLKSNREPDWVNMFWDPEREGHVGVSIYQSITSPSNLDIFFETYALIGQQLVLKPCFLQVNQNSGAGGFYFDHNSAGLENVLPISMIQTPSGYLTKSLVDYGDGGFYLAQLGTSGQTDCAGFGYMHHQSLQTETTKFKYFPTDHGTKQNRSVLVSALNAQMTPCDERVGHEFRLTTDEEGAEAEYSESFSLYPNPIAENGGNLQLSYTIATDKEVEIVVFNAIGQQTALQKVSFNAGSQVLELENSLLSPGLNLVTIRSEGELLFQDRVMMH